MKSEAKKYVLNFYDTLNYSIKEFSLLKSKQPSGKPVYLCYLTFEDFTMNGVVFKNKNNKWIYHHSVTQGLLTQESSSFEGTKFAIESAKESYIQSQIKLEKNENRQEDSDKIKKKLEILSNRNLKRAYIL